MARLEKTKNSFIKDMNNPNILNCVVMVKTTSNLASSRPLSNNQRQNKFRREKSH